MYTEGQEKEIKAVKHCLMHKYLSGQPWMNALAFYGGLFCRDLVFGVDVLQSEGIEKL